MKIRSIYSTPLVPVISVILLIGLMGCEDGIVTYDTAVTQQGQLTSQSLTLDACDITVGLGDNIQDAIDGANDGDVVCLEPGFHIQSTQLTINKPLTLQGTGTTAEETAVDFENDHSFVIAADDVNVLNLHLISNAAYFIDVPHKGGVGTGNPDVLYENITFNHIIVEGGRRSMWLHVRNLTITNSEFRHNDNRQAIQIRSVQGATNITNNTFLGGSVSRAAIIFEGASDSRTRGTINISDNTMNSHSQFVLFNLSGWEDVDALTVMGNVVDHETRSGSSIIFMSGDFGEIDEILISDNSINNPNPERLAVYVDYRYGGDSVPADGQIVVHNLTFDIAEPWGSSDDTVHEHCPVGFSTNAPEDMSLTAFNVEGCIPEPTDPQTKDDCKKGGWQQYGFRNQGQCIAFVNTGRDSR